jgi:hypothetical protein
MPDLTAFQTDAFQDDAFQMEVTGGDEGRWIIHRREKERRKRLERDDDEIMMIMSVIGRPHQRFRRDM